MEWWLWMAAGISVATGLWRLWRVGNRDILGCVLFAALGVSLGALVGTVLPGGLALGSVGGAALAWTRLDVGRTRRRVEWSESVKQSSSPAEARLALHDRLDSLSSVERSHTRLISVLAVAALAVGSVIAVLGGLFLGSLDGILLGVGLGFVPASVAAQRSIESREQREVSRMLDRFNDP